MVLVQLTSNYTLWHRTDIVIVPTNAIGESKYLSRFCDQISGVSHSHDGCKYCVQHKTFDIPLMLLFASVRVLKTATLVCVCFCSHATLSSPQCPLLETINFECCRFKSHVSLNLLSTSAISVFTIASIFQRPERTIIFCWQAGVSQSNTDRKICLMRNYIHNKYLEDMSTNLFVLLSACNRAQHKSDTERLCWHIGTWLQQMPQYLMTWLWACGWMKYVVCTLEIMVLIHCSALTTGAIDVSAPGILTLSYSGILEDLVVLGIVTIVIDLFAYNRLLCKMTITQLPSFIKTIVYL